MFHGHVELLVLTTPLGWGDRGKVHFGYREYMFVLCLFGGMDGENG